MKYKNYFLNIYNNKHKESSIKNEIDLPKSDDGNRNELRRKLRAQQFAPLKDMI